MGFPACARGLGSLHGLLAGGLWLGFGLQRGEISFETVEAFVPEAAVGSEPAVDLLQPVGFEAAGAPLGFAAALDKARTFQHFQVPGDGRERNIERLCKFTDGGFAACQARNDSRGVWGLRGLRTFRSEGSI